MEKEIRKEGRKPSEKYRGKGKKKTRKWRGGSKMIEKRDKRETERAKIQILSPDQLKCML